MSMVTIIFYFFVLMASLSAIGILLMTNVFKAALLLLICLLSVAALYILAFAEFVAITQILIYAGGVLVLILFGIMLTSKLSGKPLQVSNTNLFIGFLACVLLFTLLVNFISDYMIISLPNASLPENITTIGTNFMTGYALPFEISGILLLVALIGAAVITSFIKTKKL